jgi:hypothetical protein
MGALYTLMNASSCGKRRDAAWQRDGDDVVDETHKVLLPLEVFLNLFVEPGLKLRDELTVLTAHICPRTGATPAFHGALDFADYVDGGLRIVWPQGNRITVTR